MLRSLALSAVIAAGFCGAAHADVYRWVDEHGEAHYSDQWVPGSELIKSSKPRPMNSDSSTPASETKTPTANASQSASDKLQDKIAQDAVKQDVTKTKEVQCKQAKERYQKAIDARRIYKPAKDGDSDRVYMSDAETDAYRLSARKDVILACGSPPAPVQPTETSEQPSE